MRGRLGKCEGNGTCRRSPGEQGDGKEAWRTESRKGSLENRERVRKPGEQGVEKRKKNLHLQEHDVVETNRVIFWVRKLFYDLKPLPCVFFLFYVMGSEGDCYRPM